MPHRKVRVDLLQRWPEVLLVVAVVVVQLLFEELPCAQQIVRALLGTALERSQGCVEPRDVPAEGSVDDGAYRPVLPASSFATR